MNVIKLDLDKVNAYLIEENGQFILVDTGGYMLADGKTLNSRRAELEKLLEQNGCTKENMKLLILTHGDNDHCMNAAYIKEKYEIPIAMHAADRELVENPTLELAMKSFHYRSFGMKLFGKLMNGICEKVMRKTLADFTTFTPDIFLKDGDSLEQYGFHGTILHLPGHTPGSIGILLENQTIIVGDAGKNAMNALDFKAFDESVKKIEACNPLKIYTGH